MVVHAVAADPEGPFEETGLAVPPYAHNPDAILTPNGTVVIFHIGAGVPYAGKPLADCSHSGNGTTPIEPPELAVPVPSPPGFTPGDGIHTALTPNGPFTWFDGASLGFAGCNNPAPAVLPNGSIAVWCYSKGVNVSHRVTFAIYLAEAWGKPFRRLDTGDGTGNVEVAYPGWLMEASGGAIFNDDPTMSSTGAETGTSCRTTEPGRRRAGWPPRPGCGIATATRPRSVAGAICTPRTGCIGRSRRSRPSTPLSASPMARLPTSVSSRPPAIHLRHASDPLFNPPRASVPACLRA